VVKYLRVFSHVGFFVALLSLALDAVKDRSSAEPMLHLTGRERLFLGVHVSPKPLRQVSLE